MRKLCIFLFVFVLGSSVFAADYNVYKLDSGQIVIIQQVKNNPIVTIDTWIKTGSINENEKNNGVSHFLEHLFFKGTKNHPPGEFDKILESKGAITNAATSKDFTHYYVTIPSKYFDLAMDLHADMLLNPLVPRKELEKERKVVMEEISKDANNPSESVFDNLIEMMYTTHPYKRKVLGTNEIIGKITREEILEYYNTHYAPQNMITIVIGDVDPQHALEKVKEDFSVAQERKCEKNINKAEKKLTSKFIKVDYQPSQSGYLLIGYRGANSSNADTYALDILSTILGSGHSSILNQSIKEQKQLAFSISASNLTYKEDGLFIISANFIPDNADKLQRAIFDEIKKVKKQGFSEEDLQRAKKVIERDTYYSRESISNIASEIGYTTVLTDNPKYYDEYLASIKKVSLSDLRRVADEYLSESACAVSIVLPPESKQAKSSTIAKPNHVAKMVKESGGLKKYSLDNQATLLLSPNNLNDIVAMSIYIKGGEFLEKIPGTANMMSSLMSKGTKKYSSLELAQVMEENGVKIDVSSNADTFSINVLTTKSQLPLTYDLLNELINNAVFDDYEIEKTRANKLNAIKKSHDVPLNVSLDEYRYLIYENSVYANGPKVFEKTLSKIQREDILEYYSTIFNPKNIVISVNGDVDSVDLINKFSDMFSKTQTAGFNYSDYSAKIPAIVNSKTSIKTKKDLRTAWLILGWQTSGFPNQKDYATLQVIDSILGSGMSSRLFKNVRDQEGLAYQLGSSFSPKMLKGVFTLYIGTNPKTLDFAKQKLFEEVNKLKTGFVSDKELQEAKEKIMGNYVISLETNLEKASTLGWFEASGRGFEFNNNYEKLINSVTSSDIIEVANKYFNDNYVISIIKGDN